MAKQMRSKESIINRLNSEWNNFVKVLKENIEAPKEQASAIMGRLEKGRTLNTGEYTLAVKMAELSQEFINALGLDLENPTYANISRRDFEDSVGELPEDTLYYRRLVALEHAKELLQTRLNRKAASPSTTNPFDGAYSEWICELRALVDMIDQKMFSLDWVANIFKLNIKQLQEAE